MAVLSEHIAWIHFVPWISWMDYRVKQTCIYSRRMTVQCTNAVTSTTWGVVVSLEEMHKCCDVHGFRVQHVSFFRFCYTSLPSASNNCVSMRQEQFEAISGVCIQRA